MTPKVIKTSASVNAPNGIFLRLKLKNGLENLVAGDVSLNRGDYKKLEVQIAKEVSAGKDVYMRVDLDYPGKSYRPDSFIVSYSINGEEFTTTFFNTPRGEVK